MTPDELTLKAISTYNGNLHNGLTKALEAVVAIALEEAAKVADAYDPRCDVCPRGVAAAINAWPRMKIIPYWELRTNAKSYEIILPLPQKEPSE